MHRLHDRKDDGDRERNRQRHHRARPQAKADDADRHDDGDRLPQRFHELADGGLNDDRLVGHQRRVDAERQIGDALVDRLFHVAAERQNVAAVAHGDGEADRRLAVDAKHRLGRIGIAAPDGRDVAQPDQTAVGQEIDVEKVRFRSEGAGNAEQNLLIAGLERARGTDRILGSERREQGRAVDAEAGQFLGRELDIDLLVLRAEELDLRNVRNLQETRADVLDIVAQFPMREAVGGEAVDQSEGVAEIVVEAGSDDAGRQRAADVADVLAHLIPDVRHFRGFGRALEVDEDRRPAGDGVAAQEVEPLASPAACARAVR